MTAEQEIKKLLKTIEKRLEANRQDPLEMGICRWASGSIENHPKTRRHRPSLNRSRKRDHMESRYIVYWIHENGGNSEIRHLDTLEEALMCFLHMSKKHNRVVMRQNFRRENKEL